MGRFARADIAEPRQQRRTDQVIVAQHRATRRQPFGDQPELAPVEHLPVREMHVGDRELAILDHLADPPDQGAGLQRPDRRRAAKGFRAPAGDAVDAARERRSGVITADPVGQMVDLPGGLLHEHQVGPLALDQPDHVVDGSASSPKQVPTDNFQAITLRGFKQYPLTGAAGCGHWRRTRSPAYSLRPAAPDPGKFPDHRTPARRPARRARSAGREAGRRAR